MILPPKDENGFPGKGKKSKGPSFNRIPRLAPSFPRIETELWVYPNERGTQKDKCEHGNKGPAKRSKRNDFLAINCLEFLFHSLLSGFEDSWRKAWFFGLPFTGDFYDSKHPLSFSPVKLTYLAGKPTVITGQPKDDRVKFVAGP